MKNVPIAEQLANPVPCALLDKDVVDAKSMRSTELDDLLIRSNSRKPLFDYIFFQASPEVSHEQAQGLARVAISATMCCVLFFSLDVTSSTRDAISVFLAFLYSLLSVGYYFFLVVHKENFRWRRYIAIIADLGVVSYAFFRFGVNGIAFYPLYLWIMIGNGLRFGVRYLGIASLVGIVGFSAAAGIGGVTEQHSSVILGLLIGLVVIPKFFLVMIKRIADANGVLKRHIEDAQYRATHDELTGLPNRTVLNDRLQHALENAEREETLLAVVFLDLDGFKAINDNFGHESGDQLLREVASCLERSVRSCDTVSRLGGDEFIVLLENASDTAGILSIVDRINSCSGSYYSIGEYQTYISWSCGVAIYPKDGEDVQTLVKNADTAMYRAKASRTRRVCVYDGSMSEEVAAQLSLRDQLRKAVDNQELTLHYQPQINLLTNRIVGAEALLRWHHPQRGMIPPGEFIPVAEQTGLIVAAGLQVLETVAQTLSRFRDRQLPLVPIYVNVSPQQLSEPDFLDTLMAVVRRYRISPEALGLEVTENLLIEDAEQTKVLLDALKSLGFKIALDDFGTGFSSLSYLTLFPIDRIKIDQSFFRDFPHNQHQCSIVDAILAIGNKLEMEVIAEGVETQVQAESLIKRGCSILQGYYSAKPTPRSEYELLLERSMV
ncbi:MAG: EAL domain-containing protein [Pseudomonadota bacterium]|nr:EAL domain-containing protein [Pseudomonadota bacterium]